MHHKYLSIKDASHQIRLERHHQHLHSSSPRQRGDACHAVIPSPQNRDQLKLQPPREQLHRTCQLPEQVFYELCLPLAEPRSPEFTIDVCLEPQR